MSSHLYRTLVNILDWQPGPLEALRPALRGDFDQLALSREPTLGAVLGLPRSEVGSPIP
jgi:hypothetical protein